MNKLTAAGLGVAAAVVALVVGIQLLGPPAPGGSGASPSADPSATVEPSPTAPSATPWTGLSQGPFVLTGSADPVQVAVTITSPSWVALPEFDGVGKNDDGLDPPQTVGAALIAWGWPAGTGFYVYGDPCHWATTTPEAPATTPEEIATALAAQASREATAPVDVTVGGYAGKAITVHVPMEYEVPGASREEEFAECDQSIFGLYGVDGETEPARNNQGPGQVDDLWIIDVNGSIVILDAMHGPAVPASLVDEIRALAESATFE